MSVKECMDKQVRVSEKDRSVCKGESWLKASEKDCEGERV